MIMNNKTKPGARRSFKQHAIEFAGKPITYVEIGLWVGACAEWVCQNILTHPQSIGYGIDPFIGRLDMQNFVIQRMEPYRFIIYSNYSWNILRNWKGPLIDLLYIDGDHTAIGALTDWVTTWPWLRVGAGIILDDYTPRVPGVIQAVAAIREVYGDKIIPWGRQGYQVAFRKIEE